MHGGVYEVKGLSKKESQMLVLSRKPISGQNTIHVDGPATFVITNVKGQTVKVGVQAAPNVRIRRGELEPNEVVPEDE